MHFLSGSSAIFPGGNCRIFPAISQTSPPNCIAVSNRPEIALKSQLVYTYDFFGEFERDKNCTEKCDKNCTKDRMCKPAITISFEYSNLIRGNKTCIMDEWSLAVFTRQLKRPAIPATSREICPEGSANARKPQQAQVGISLPVS